MNDVYSYTNIQHNGYIYIYIYIYCCHSFYGNTGSWYDWDYFDWDTFDSLIPAIILMIIDLSHSITNYEVDINPDELSIIGDNVAALKNLKIQMGCSKGRQKSINLTF